MKHLGDITKISGYTAPIVDCIIGGSPCQDLSVAGKRAGLEGERSGLFMEQIRIVKEMRKQDERNGRTDVNIRPRYMVWENVPGAFSSNKGEDFRVVLEEIARVKDKNASIPLPNKGKWTTSGGIVGDGWSIAWRVLDAQFWGVPQRRRRIALVADFGGESASEILFVRQSLSGHLDESQQERKDSTTNASRGTGANDCCTYNIGDRYGVPAEHKDLSPTLTARCGTGGNNVPAVVQPSFTMQDREGKEGGGKGALIAEEISATLRANNAQYLFQPVKEETYVDVEMEVAVRKYEVDKEKLVAVLRGHKGKLTNKEIADTLDKPLTLVEHWFRKDNSFAIPDADIWFQLKELLGIETTEFDQAVTEFEFKGSNYDMRNRIYTGDASPTLTCGCGDNLHLLPTVFSKSKRAQTENDFETWKESDKANTLNAFDTGDVRTSEAVVYAVDQGGGKSSANVTEGTSPTLTCTHGGEPVIALDRASFNQGKNAQYDFEISDKGVNSPLVAKGPGAVCYTIDEKCANTYVWEEQANTLAARDYKQPQTVVAVDCRNGTESEVNGALQSNSAHSLNGNNTVRTRYIVRRLTPLECERLQGYPDGWTDIGEYIDSNGKKRQTSDASRYKALGNSIALPPWKWVLKRICACYERDATMASLFDGIGGFPYLWEQLNGKGTCLWASEIEEFPMAVTKVRIGE